MEFPSNTLRFISQHFLVDEKILSKTISLEAVATPPHHAAAAAYPKSTCVCLLPAGSVNSMETGSLRSLPKQEEKLCQNEGDLGQVLIIWVDNQNTARDGTLNR